MWLTKKHRCWGFVQAIIHVRDAERWKRRRSYTTQYLTNDDPRHLPHEWSGRPLLFLRANFNIYASLWGFTFLTNLRDITRNVKRFRVKQFYCGYLSLPGILPETPQHWPKPEKCRYPLVDLWERTKWESPRVKICWKNCQRASTNVSASWLCVLFNNAMPPAGEGK